MRPLYYRFVFSPETGNVDLSDNHEGHPAYIQYHKDLAVTTDSKSPVHGYAYRIGNGWRLTDYEDKPFKDNFIKTQVTRSIRKAEGHEDNKPPEGPNWPDLQPDFTRFHYGLPV